MRDFSAELGLEDHTNLASQARGIDGDSVTHDDRMACGRHHKRGENAEEGGFATAVRAKKAEEFGWANIE